MFKISHILLLVLPLTAYQRIEGCFLHRYHDELDGESGCNPVRIETNKIKKIKWQMSKLAD